MKIKQIKAREILDSRGNPTVEVEIFGEEKSLFSKREEKAWASVPSGASTGDFEAIELRDGNKKRFHGKGMLKVVKNIDEIIAPALIGMDVTLQKEIDEKMLELDGTDNKANLGANAILGVSMAVARLGAISKRQKLFEYVAGLADREISEIEIVRPFFNVINGGNHAGNKIAFQEFMVSPNLGSFKDNYRAGSEIYHTLQKILKAKFGGASTLLGDEGGFAPDDFKREKEALDVLMEAIREAGYEKRVDIALDVAASEFFVDGNYDLGFKMVKTPSIPLQKGGHIKTTDEMIEIYKELVIEYPIISIEDPFDQTDFEAFAKLKAVLTEKKIQVVGDDLTVSTPSRIQTAIDKKSCNALLLKVNQIGSVSEAIEAHQLARSADWKTMVSHRSGETTDDFIADFAVGIGAEQIKSGATARGERICKYNRLQAIEEMIK
jgi:enolase